MEYKKLTLKNGFRILLVPHRGSLATTVLILVEAGSEYETKRINGISHFLEHLVFKGTKNRPKPGMIADELDSLGAEYNAFTGQEYTGYWAKAQNKKVAQILDIVSDLYLNPIFNAEEIDRERGVVIEEINLYEDTPTRRVQDVFMSLLYGDTPAGWDVAGRKEVIRALKRGDFIAYRRQHYVPSAAVVIVAGDFDRSHVREEVKKRFESLRPARKWPKVKTREHQRRPQMRVKFKDSDQSHLVLGVRAFDIFDRRRYALQVLADLLGGGMSSRLFRRVREELGAAYYIRAGADLFLDHGYLAISAGVDHAKIKSVIEIILEELNRLRRDLVPPPELRKSKDHLTGGLLLGLETSDQLASYYGGQEILTRALLRPAALIDKIQNVRAEEIRILARSIVANAKLNLAIIGPYRNPAVFRNMLSL